MDSCRSPPTSVGGVLAGVLEVDPVGVCGLPRGGHVQAPLVEGIGDHDRLGERGRGAHADGLLVGQPAEHLVGVVREVGGAAVIQQHHEVLAAGEVGGGLVAGGHDVAGLLQRLIADGEGDLAERVRVVHIGDGEVALARQVQHVLEALALRLLGGEAALEGQGLDGLQRLLERLEALGADGDLGGVVVLGDLAADAHGVADRDLVHGVRGVDEHGGGARVRGEVQRSPGAAGLDDVTVQAAGRVHRGDHALGGHGIADQRALGTGALDLGDRRLDGVDRLLRIAGITRVTRVSGVGLLGARRGGGRLPLDEVGGVLTGHVHAGDGGGVVGLGCRGLAGEGLRRAPAHEVHDRRVLGAGGAVAGELPVGVGEGEHAAVAGRIDSALEVCLGQGLAVAVAVGELDEEGAAGGDGAGQREAVVEVARLGGVLQGPAIDRHVGAGGVDQLDEVVLDGGAGVAATAVDLVDLQFAGGDDGGLGDRGEAGREAQAEGEGGDGAADAREARAEAGAMGDAAHAEAPGWGGWGESGAEVRRTGRAMPGTPEAAGPGEGARRLSVRGRSAP